MTESGRGRLYEGDRLVALVDYVLDMGHGRATLRVVGSPHALTEEIMKEPPVNLTLHLEDGRRLDCFLKETELGSTFGVAVARGRRGDLT